MFSKLDEQVYENLRQLMKKNRDMYYSYYLLNELALKGITNDS